MPRPRLPSAAGCGKLLRYLAKAMNIIYNCRKSERLFIDLVWTANARKTWRQRHAIDLRLTVTFHFILLRLRSTNRSFWTNQTENWKKKFKRFLINLFSRLASRHSNIKKTSLQKKTRWWRTREMETHANGAAAPPPLRLRSIFVGYYKTVMLITQCVARCIEYKPQKASRNTVFVCANAFFFWEKIEFDAVNNAVKLNVSAISASGASATAFKPLSTAPSAIWSASCNAFGRLSTRKLMQEIRIIHKICSAGSNTLNYANYFPYSLSFLSFCNFFFFRANISLWIINIF